MALNKDGLEGGSLVDFATVSRINREKAAKAREQQQKEAEAKAKKGS